MTDTIPFTQFMRPNGVPKLMEAPVPEGYEDMVNRILDAGLQFTCEVLRTGQVALYIGNGEEDFAIEIAPNGPEVEDALKRLIVGGIGHLDAVEQSDDRQA